LAIVRWFGGGLDVSGTSGATAGEDPVLAAVPGGTDGDDDMFDDSAIEALAKETDSVGTPFSPDRNAP
jgi:hypothetical protein